MATSTRLIRRRIKSVTNTRKITKAMELVAASKMRKAVSSVLGTRPYAQAAWLAVRQIAKVSDAEMHPLLAKRDGNGRALVILLTSDGGLCGGFNSQMLRAATVFMRKRGTENVDVVAIGRKGQDACRRFGWNMVATFTALANAPQVSDVRPVADLAIGDYMSGKYDEVFLAYTDYRSALIQKPVIGRLLPLTHIEGLGEASETLFGVEEPGETIAEDGQAGPREYLFEPSPQEVLDAMLPRIVEAEIFQAVLESTASEHSARMMSMRSASDAADEMIDNLTLTYNQARQAGITAEIAEISSGKAALEG